jgi:hypothetical protein
LKQDQKKAISTSDEQRHLNFGITALGDFGATAGAVCQEYLCGMKVRGAALFRNQG